MVSWLMRAPPVPTRTARTSAIAASSAAEAWAPASSSSRTRSPASVEVGGQLRPVLVEQISRLGSGFGDLAGQPLFQQHHRAFHASHRDIQATTLARFHRHRLLHSRMRPR